MENIRNNFILINQNRNLRIINERNNRINSYKFVFSTIFYIYIIPILIFFIIKNNQTILQYIFPNNDNINKNNTLTNNPIRNLDNNRNIIIQYNKNDFSAEEDIKKFINMILERFSKGLFDDSSKKNEPIISNKTLYFINSEEFFNRQLVKKPYKGIWDYNTQSKEVSENLTQQNSYDIFKKILYKNSVQKSFSLGKATNGTAYMRFEKGYQRINRNITHEILSVNIKLLEGKYTDNWMLLSSNTKLANLKNYIDENRKRFYISGEFITTVTTGKIFQNILSYPKKACQSLIEIEFPLIVNNIHTYANNHTYPTKNFHIQNTNFTMTISSLCGFRLKLKGSVYNRREEILTSEIKKDLDRYLWFNVMISLLNFFASICTTYGLNKHQDTISAFNILSLSQNIAWHSYRSLSDINLALNFPQFFGPFMLTAIFPLVNFIIFDLKLLLLYWKINKRILSSRQFIALRIKFFFIFYFLMFCSYLCAGAFYFDKVLIAILAVFLWTPQIIHNTRQYNKYNYPLIFILAITLDRMIVPFYFRGNDKNFLNIKSDKNFVIYVAGFIFASIIFLYLQLFLGPRFMLSKKYQKIEIDFHKSKAEILREKPNASSEECIICLCPLFNNNEVSNNISFDNNDNNINENKDSQLKIGNESVKNSIDNYTSVNQTTKKNEDIIEIAKNKKIKSAKKMKLYKDNINPIIIKDSFLDVKPRHSHKIKIGVSFYKTILLILKVILWDNFLFFYKYDKNKKNKKYMMIKCGHVFHSKCLEQWLEIKKECPSCRASVQNYI